jgi:hypothetical protein
VTPQALAVMGSSGPLGGLVLAGAWIAAMMIWSVSQSNTARSSSVAAQEKSCKASTAVITAIQLVPYKLRAAELTEVRCGHGAPPLPCK